MARPKTSRSFRVEIITIGSGAKRFRVVGWDAHGKRVRELYELETAALARRNELENTWLGGEKAGRETLRATSLTIDQVRAAEAASLTLSDPVDLLAAVAAWNASKARRRQAKDCPRLDEAFRQWKEWLESPECHLRERSKRGTRGNLERWIVNMDNVRLSDLTSDLLRESIAERWKTPGSRDLIRREVSSFLTWCMESPRRWIDVNVANGKIVRFRKGVKRPEPEVFTLKECARLLVAARRFRGGKFLSYVVLQLLCGIRREEVTRINWERDINLDDGEIRLNGHQVKTGSGRTIHLGPSAIAWLRVCPDVPIADAYNSRLLWDEMRKMAKLKRWPRDGMRHTAISHYFRQCGSYGLTAEWAGNSEAVIKAHYQGRVSTEDSAIFWSWFPGQQDRARARAERAKIIRIPSAGGSRRAAVRATP